jgi:HlyD family secretion protein
VPLPRPAEGALPGAFCFWRREQALTHQRAVRAASAIALGLTLSACGDGPPAGPIWSGYAEGDYIHIAAPLPGTLSQLAVQAGDTVARGAALFALDAQAETAARDEAAARLAAAQAQAADTTKGRRAEEVAVTRAQLAHAQAQADLANADLARQRQLTEQEFVARARLDDAQAALAQAQARVAELTAALKVAALPARSDDRAAASAQVKAAAQALRQADWRLAQKQQHAPQGGQVSEVYFRAGEYVGAGQPVLALLPPAQLKARFYVPQAELARVLPGQAVELRCDGCGAPIAATVLRVATQAEYTPPVIYSNAQRAKLVFLVEAWPAPADATRLHPGQPLEVRPVTGTAPAGAPTPPAPAGSAAAPTAVSTAASRP